MKSHLSAICLLLLHSTNATIYIDQSCDGIRSDVENAINTALSWASGATNYLYHQDQRIMSAANLLFENTDSARGKFKLQISRRK
jgi:hypothetical protein